MAAATESYSQQRTNIDGPKAPGDWKWNRRERPARDAALHDASRLLTCLGLLAVLCRFRRLATSFPAGPGNSSHRLADERDVAR